MGPEPAALVQHTGDATHRDALCLSARPRAATRAMADIRALPTLPMGYLGMALLHIRRPRHPEAALRRRDDRPRGLVSFGRGVLRYRRPARSAPVQGFRRSAWVRPVGVRTGRESHGPVGLDAWSLCGRLVRRARPTSSLPPPQRAGTCSGVCPDPQRQRRRPGHSDSAGVGGKRGRLRHQGRELGQDGGFPARKVHLCFKFSPVEDGAHRGSILLRKFGSSLRATFPTRRTSRT